MDRILSKPQLSQNPIFIVGFPRSGTTLLQTMLATQENMYSFPETHYFCSILRNLEFDNTDLINSQYLGIAFEKIKDFTELEFSEKTKFAIQSKADKGELTGKLLFEYMVSSFLSKEVEVEQLSTIQWIEKTPAHVFHIDVISEYYPEAKFIEIIRNPLNAIYSWKKNWGDDYTASVLALRWKRSIDTFKTFKDDNPGKAYTVIYENLIKQPKDEFRLISDFLGIVPDLKRLKNLQKTARKFVLKHETWKKNNVNKGIINQKTNYKWSFNERLKMQYLLKNELVDLGYVSDYPFSQQVFNTWMNTTSRLTTFSLMNPLKKPVKYLVKKVGMWPYLK